VKDMKIIIDTYGADKGPAPIIDGALSAARKHPEVTFVLVGDCADISAKAAGMENIEIIDAHDFIETKEPATAIFTRGEASMAIALDRLKSDGDLLGMLSAGNSGALFVGTICRLGLVGGLKTPAMCALLPTLTDGRVCLCDCGANINCTPDDLVNFGLMGSAFISALLGKKDPAVGILSVGKESSKGSPLTLEAYKLLKTQPVNFIGNVESGDVLYDRVDVVVTDGFSGNLILKDVEATGVAAAELMKAHALSKSGDSPFDSETYGYVRNFFDLNSNGGAIFLGTKKAVVKMHGAANENTVVSCTELLLTLCSREIGERVEQAIKGRV